MVVADLIGGLTERDRATLARAADVIATMIGS